MTVAVLDITLLFVEFNLSPCYLFMFITYVPCNKTKKNFNFGHIPNFEINLKARNTSKKK